jgi:hypothetical protein
MRACCKECSYLQIEDGMLGRWCILFGNIFFDDLRIAWDNTLKDAERAAFYDDALVKFDITQGDNNFLYQWVEHYEVDLEHIDA